MLGIAKDATSNTRYRSKLKRELTYGFVQANVSIKKERDPPYSLSFTLLLVLSDPIHSIAASVKAAEAARQLLFVVCP